MKVTKQALKKLVKECLVEILSEGLGDKQKKRMSKTPSRSAQPRRRAPDLVHFNDTVNEAVGALTNDPVMASIFEDTAKTTLQEQISAGTPAQASHPGGLSSPNSGELIGDPSEIFETSAKNWASLAFLD